MIYVIMLVTENVQFEIIMFELFRYLYVYLI